MNLSLIGYAPSANPEVALAVLVPWAYEGTVDNRASLRIGKRVLDMYFQMENQ